MQAVDVLRMATLGGAELMGVADRVGSLEVGKFADFLLITPPSPVFDAAATVVFSVNNADVEAVYVGGRKLVEGLALTHADHAGVRGEVETRVARIRNGAQKR
jgi:5-methylthioadenosine/S-adenosylhomocysteine deaminase